jgi:ATP-dependent Clp protease ATP-binding subunit ClpC
VFERFTERARQVVVHAQDEARDLKHGYIGTEHILLGLLRVEEGLAARVLGSLDIAIEKVREQVARIVGEGDKVDRGQIPFTPRAKKLLELGLKEANQLGHKYIGTEHILLGLVREHEGVASHILDGFGADADTVRGEVIRWLSDPRHRRAFEETQRQAESERRVRVAGTLQAAINVGIYAVRAARDVAVGENDFERAAALRAVERELHQIQPDLPGPSRDTNEPAKPDPE